MNTTDVIALLALILAAFTFWQQKKINTTNLQAVYYEEVFKDFFLKKIPDSVEKIDFNEEGQLENSYKELNQVFMEMMEKCKYFAYANHSFYQELKRMVQALEDKLITESAHKVESLEERAQFVYSVHQDVMKIIKLINKYYTK